MYHADLVRLTAPAFFSEPTVFFDTDAASESLQPPTLGSFTRF